MSSGFYGQIYKLIKKIPCGKVATYGQIAALLNKPQSAQLVGWALKICPHHIPWQRVVNRYGMISIVNPRITKLWQVELLRCEGVIVDKRGENFFIDLKRYLWQPKKL